VAEPALIGPGVMKDISGLRLKILFSPYIPEDVVVVSDKLRNKFEDSTVLTQQAEKVAKEIQEIIIKSKSEIRGNDETTTHT
jgi:hypothetical protein